MTSIQDLRERWKSYGKKYYDGQVKEGTDEQAAEFDELYHDDCQFFSFGHSSNLAVSNATIKTKSDRVKDEAKFMKLGFTAKETLFEILDDQTKILLLL